MNKTKIILITILATAFLVRIFGINYGLPLWVVPDEPGSVFGALKMIELKSLIPANHIEEFLRVLYYPPFISYIYIIPFSALLGLKFIFADIPMADFKNFAMLDLSWFFIIARFFSVILGTATVWLVYKISKNLFEKEAPALLSAGFLSIALLHVSFSHWTRHWIWATFLLTIIIYFLSRQDFSPKKKYLLASLVAGIGMGINYQVGLSIFFMLFWFFFYDNLSLKKILKERWSYGAIVIFLSLFVLTIYIYPATTGARDLFADGKISFLDGCVFYFKNLLKTDPAFLFFTLFGFIVSFIYQKKYFWSAFIFSLFYIALFDLIYLNNGRYILMLYPIFAITAGYGAYKLLKLNSFKARFCATIAVSTAFIFMGANTIKFDYLLIKNDTRKQVLDWAIKNLPEESKIVVAAPLTRFPSTLEAIKEQESIDVFSLRNIDRAEKNIDQSKRKGKKFHALNLYTVKELWFAENLENYIKKEKYQYFIYNPFLLEKKNVPLYFYSQGITLKTFKGFDNEKLDMVEDNGGGIKNIYNLKNSGPTIIIKKLF